MLIILAGESKGIIIVHVANEANAGVYMSRRTSVYTYLHIGGYIIPGYSFQNSVFGRYLPESTSSICPVGGGGHGWALTRGPPVIQI